MVAVAAIIVLLLGAAVSVLSVWGMIAPEKLIRMVRAVLDREAGIYVAVGSRLLLGTALIVSAPASEMPLIFNVLGALALLGAVAVPFIGRARLARIIEWFARFPPVAIRAWLVFGLAFGVLLIYGILPGLI